MKYIEPVVIDPVTGFGRGGSLWRCTSESVMDAARVRVAMTDVHVCDEQIK